MRRFDTGATRDSDDGKLDYEGFLSPRVLRRYAEYMHRKRNTPEGVRSSDNWQKGIPEDVYLKSLIRHTLQLWEAEREGEVPWVEEEYISEEDFIEETLCAIMFNAMGLLYEKGLHKNLGKDYNEFVNSVFNRAGFTSGDNMSLGGACDPGVDEAVLANGTTIPEPTYEEEYSRICREIARDMLNAEREAEIALDDYFDGAYDDVLDFDSRDGGERRAED